MESLGAIQELSKMTVNIKHFSFKNYSTYIQLQSMYIFRHAKNCAYFSYYILQKILTSRMIELETKNEILEVVLRNMVSESMNMSIPN